MTPGFLVCEMEWIAVQFFELRNTGKKLTSFGRGKTMIWM